MLGTLSFRAASVAASLGVAPPPDPDRSDELADDDLDLEDDSIDLPPPDGGHDEDGDGPAGGDDDLGLDVADERDSLDDAVAGDLDVGEHVAFDETDAPADEPGDEIDVGALDEGLVTAFEGDRAVDEGEGVDDDLDDDLEAGRPGDLDDGGLEGLAVEEDLVDEGQLPVLDADDDGEVGDDEELIAALADADAAKRLPAWSEAPFRAREGSGAEVPCAALCVAGGRLIAVGDAVLVVDDGAHAARRLATSPGGVSVAHAAGAIVVATARGQLVAIDEAGAAAPVAGFRPRKERVELAATPGRLWVRAGEALYRVESIRGDEGAPAPARAHGVIAIAAHGGVLVALTNGDQGPALERLRGDDEGWRVRPLAGEPRHAPLAGALLAAGGSTRAVAIAVGDATYLTRDEGATWQALSFGRAVGLAFAGDEADAPLLALVEGAAGGEAFVVLVPADDEPTLVARVPAAPEGAARADARGGAAIAWDASREVAWVATRAGLVAVGPERRH